MIPMAANLTVPFLAKRLGKRNLYSGAAAVQFLGLVVILAGGFHTGIIVMIVATREAIDVLPI